MSQGQYVYGSARLMQLAKRRRLVRGLMESERSSAFVRSSALLLVSTEPDKRTTNPKRGGTLRIAQASSLIGHGRWNGCIDPAGPEGADGANRAGPTVGKALPNAQCCAGSLR